MKNGGLSICSTISSKENILSCMKKHLLDELNNHYNPAIRLDIMLIVTNYDLFAADVYYHKASYNRFTNEYQKKPTATSFTETAILHYFLRQIELKVIKDHEAFLVNELMQDIQEISEEHGLEEPPAEFRHRNRMKEKLLVHFGEKIK